MLVWVLWAHVVGLMVFGAIQGFSLLHAGVVVFPAALLAFAAGWPAFRNRRVRAGCAALGLLASSAALVYLWNGAIEAHFHFFVMLAVVAMYEDWAPYLVAVGFVLLHHGLLGTVSPSHVFHHGGSQSDAWKWAIIHALFIAAASVATIATWRHIEVAPAAARERAREQAALRRVAEAVAANPGDPTLFDLVAEEAAALLGVETGVVARYDETRARIVGGWGTHEGARGWLPLDGDSALAQVWRSGRPARVTYGGPQGPGPGRTPDGTEFRGDAVAVPVIVASRLWGGIAVASSASGGLAPGTEERFAAFGELAALGIANAEARRELESRASTDPLTGLVNHRTFHERLGAEVERAHRHERELSLVVLDLDHFKRVNDSHGHPVGDEVLVELAERLRAEARPGDVLGRIGGEEFAWLLPETGGLDAWRCAERVRQRVRRAAFAVAGTLTVSAGVSDLGQAGAPGELVRLADQALYWAKRHGRDVTFRYSTEVSARLDGIDQAESVARAHTFQTLRSLAQAADGKHPATRGHSESVGDLALAIAAALGWPSDRANELRDAGLLHDIGMIAVPDAIVQNPGPLTSEEYRQVTGHAATGAQIAGDVLSVAQTSWIRGHHERWDGGGYPDGLAGGAIPEGARILALAEAWEAMTSPRPYREQRAPAAALAECRRAAGSQFPAALVDVLEQLLRTGTLAGIRADWDHAAAPSPTSPTGLLIEA
jgi:diguanylate cyclase (GGDEF)-like protein